MSRELAGLKSWESQGLNGIAITDVCMTQPAPLERLQWLDFSGTLVTDVSLNGAEAGVAGVSD